MNVNDAFHTLVDTGTPADNAYRKITDALTGGDLGLWCESRKIELHEIRSRLRFIIHDGDLLVGSTETLGWPPGMYVFTVDTAEFERLLGRRRRGAQPKLSAEALEKEVERRRSAGLPVSHSRLAKHFQVHRKTIGRVLKK